MSLQRIPREQLLILHNLKELSENLCIKPNHYIISELCEMYKKLEKKIKHSEHKNSKYIDNLLNPENILNFYPQPHSPTPKHTIDLSNLNFDDGSDDEFHPAFHQHFQQQESINYKDEELLHKKSPNPFNKYIHNYHNVIKKIMFY